MAYFRINGGYPLKGTVKVFGAKNAAMKMIAAALLTDKISTLDNVPNITDIETIIQLVRGLGVSVRRTRPHRIVINPTKLKCGNPDRKLMTMMRGSVVLVGPLLARFGEVKIPHPGGCVIGARPIDIHLDAFRKFGVKIIKENRDYHFQTKKLVGHKITFSKISVTATENILMAATLARGQTEIHNAACEPQIVDLCQLLCKMGAKITGVGSHILKITGVKKLHGATHTVIPDPIEVGTFAIAAIVSCGNVKIKDVIPKHLTSFFKVIKKAGVKFILNNRLDQKADLKILPSPALKAVSIKTSPHPGFPTDLQAPMSVLMTQATGKSTINETIFESRLKHINELAKMGARAKIIDSHRATIWGQTKLVGRRIKTFDIRSGATLIIAALVAKGQSTISQIELVDRGYEKIEERLRKLGAKITRVNR